MEELEQKEKLLRGARELFMKYGLRSVSMDDIARQLSISKKTIYQYFEDKDDIVAAVAKAYMEEQRLQYDKIAIESKNAVEEMVEISVCLKENMRNTNPTVMYDMQKYHPKAWNEWHAFKQKFIRESIVRSLKRGMEQEHFRPELHIDIIATMRLEMVQIAFDQNMFPREQYNFPEVQAQLFEHFVHGILTDKGKKLYQKYKKTSSVEILNH